MREEQPLPCVPRMVHVRLLNSFYFLQAATSDNLSTSYTDKTNIHSDFSFVNIYNSNMNDCKELTYVWGIERSGFFNGREKWAKGFENQRV